MISREEYNQRARKWRDANKEKARESCRRWKARKRALEGYPIKFCRNCNGQIRPTNRWEIRKIFCSAHCKKEWRALLRIKNKATKKINNAKFYRRLRSDPSRMKHRKNITDRWKRINRTRYLASKAKYQRKVNSPSYQADRIMKEAALIRSQLIAASQPGEDR